MPTTDRPTYPHKPIQWQLSSQHLKAGPLRDGDVRHFVRSFVCRQRVLMARRRRLIASAALTCSISLAKITGSATGNTWWHIGTAIALLWLNLLMGSATPHRIMKLIHWPLVSGLLHLVQRGGAAGSQPAQAPPRCTKCNSLPTNGQFTNHRIHCCAVLMWPLKG